MFASDYDAKGMSGAAGFSLIIHLLAVIFLFMHARQNFNTADDYMLTEITIMREIPEKAVPAVAPERPKHVLDILKQVIPIKQQAALMAVPKNALLCPEKPAHFAKAPALSMEKISAGLKPAMQAIDIDNDIGRSKLSPQDMKNPVIFKTDAREIIQPPAGPDLSRSNPCSILPGSSGNRITLASSVKHPAALSTPAVQVVTPVKTSGRGNDVVATPQKRALLIQGDAAGRKILRSVTPSYPSWLQEQGVESSVTLLFYVRPDGSVKTGITIERSSGNGELDALAVEALAAFVFERLAISADQTGYATFRFVLEK